ncbi:MAG: bifunctional 4-hydroxy-2-oxoglutarate aldolase/2-dehydro-3-deoxy-phosphogluconate aldolase [Pseudomonadota bacterium]
MNAPDQLRAALKRAPIVPVLTVEDSCYAATLAQALAAGGLTSIEITLRTPAALDSLKAMKAAAPELLVGAGTILTGSDVAMALEAGADFLVTPGVSVALAAALIDCDAPVIPGVATASEAMARYEDGFSLLKLFPASAAGGVPLLKSLQGPLPHIDFMPTGGVTAETASDYLALSNVTAVGGSWIASPRDMRARRWGEIEQRAADALSGLRPPASV